MPKPRNNGKKILVADDDRTLRYAITRLLSAAGYSVTAARDGGEALRKIGRGTFDLVFLDIWMPRMSGLEVLAHVRAAPSRPKIVVMTSDNTPETLLRAVREQAYEYISKPFPPKEAVTLARRALAEDSLPPVEVISAKPYWVELLVPCDRGAAERIQNLLMHLKADLPNEVRNSVAQAFRELLLNAIEWGGKLDPNRKVRIAYVRSPGLLMYRIADPGGGFSFEGLTHAAVGQPPDKPIEHMAVREQQGIRPGGFGILMTKASVDELLYNESQNEVLFIKYLPRQ
jgi:CheY-like chemotaxis protein